MARTWTLWPKLPDNSLVIVDRNFLAANIGLPLESVGSARHWLTRATARSKWKVLKKLGAGDEVTAYVRLPPEQVVEIGLHIDL